MDHQSAGRSSSNQYGAFWHACRFCQRVFRDKLELFCHHVNDHPEYREEINNGQQQQQHQQQLQQLQRNNNNLTTATTAHEIIYTADPR